MTNHAVHFSSKSIEHGTPAHVYDLVRQVLGVNILDPCADPGNRLGAARFYTEETNGLSQFWDGAVYMNPPYGREITKWALKLTLEYEEGRTFEAITLMPARTDTGWWRVLSRFPVCFVRGRLRFAGNTAGAPFPSCLHYLGTNPAKFAHIMSDIGDTYLPL